MKIRPFAVEEWMNAWETGAKYNIAETCVDSISLNELFELTGENKEKFLEDFCEKRLTYGDIEGYPEFKKGICKLYKTIKPEEIIPTHGATGANHHVFYSLISPGDRVISIRPTYQQLYSIPESYGADVQIIDLKKETGYLPDIEEIRRLATPETRMICINNPNNPTGAIMEKEDLEKIAEVVKKYDLFVLSDEIYSELTYTGNNHVTIASLPGMKERTILINGFSKSYAMTGWRLGYACGPEVIIKQMLKIHQFAIMCAPTTSQYAAVEALRNGDEDVAKMREEYNGRRRYLMHRFQEMGLSCFEPFGAFYVFPCIKEFGMTSEEFATKLLNSQKVAVVPGTAFGDCGEGYLRISYAYSLEDLKKALDRMEIFIQELREEKN